jgi:hypothetical protein
MKQITNIFAILAIGALTSCVSPQQYLANAELESAQQYAATMKGMNETVKKAIAEKDWNTVMRIDKSAQELEMAYKETNAAYDRERDRMLMRDQISALNAIGNELRWQRQY